MLYVSRVSVVGDQEVTLKQHSEHSLTSTDFFKSCDFINIFSLSLMSSIVGLLLCWYKHVVKFVWTFCVEIKI